MAITFNPKRKKRFSPKSIVGFILLFVVLVGVVAALILTQMSQDTRQQAAGLGSCVGPGTESCAVASGARILCGGRNESNCRALGSCGCSWQSASAGSPAPSSAPTLPPTTYNCSDVPGNYCFSSCGTGYVQVAGRTCSGNRLCCKRAGGNGTSCPPGSSSIGNGQCECSDSGAVVDYNGSCLAFTTCDGYKKAEKCTSIMDRFYCYWDKKCKQAYSCADYVNQSQCQRGDDTMNCRWKYNTCRTVK